MGLHVGGMHHGRAQCLGHVGAKDRDLTPVGRLADGLADHAIDAQATQPPLRIDGHDHVGTHPVFLDAAQADALVQAGIDAGVFTHVLVDAGLGQLEVVGTGERASAAAARFLDPGVVVLVVEAQEPELHARKAGPGIEARAAHIGARLADDSIKPGLRARQDANRAAQRGDMEGVHHRRGRQPEVDGTTDRHGHLVDRGDAFPRVDEEPLPVECHHLHVQRLDAGMSSMVCVGLRLRVDGIRRGHAADSDGGQRNDDDQRNGPQGELRPRGAAGVGGTGGRDMAGPVAPSKEQHQADDGHDDQQHQP